MKNKSGQTLYEVVFKRTVEQYFTVKVFAWNKEEAEETADYSVSDIDRGKEKEIGVEVIDYEECFDE